MIGDPLCCLHQPDGFHFCYAPTVAVLVRAADGFTTPVCETHLEDAQKATRGQLEVVPLAEWHAGARAYRPGLAGS